MGRSQYRVQSNSFVGTVKRPGYGCKICVKENVKSHQNSGILISLPLQNEWQEKGKKHFGRNGDNKSGNICTLLSFHFIKAVYNVDIL